MQLYDEEGDGLSFEDFKELLSSMLSKVAKSSIEKKSFDKTLKDIFDLFDDNSNHIKQFNVRIQKMEVQTREK